MRGLFGGRNECNNNQLPRKRDFRFWFVEAGRFFFHLNRQQKCRGNVLAVMENQALPLAVLSHMGQSVHHSLNNRVTEKFSSEFLVWEIVC